MRLWLLRDFGILGMFNEFKAFSKGFVNPVLYARRVI